MGSYKYGYKSPGIGYNPIVILLVLLITRVITSHEPPSSVRDWV